MPYDSNQAEHGETACLTVLASARAWWSCNFRCRFLAIVIRVGTMKRPATFLANQQNSEKLSYIAVTLKS